MLYNPTSEETKTILGIDINEIRELKVLLDTHGIELSNLNDFLCKKEIVNLTFLAAENNRLKRQINSAKSRLEGVFDG